MNFLLDTGSAVTLLRLDVWKQCCNTPNQLERWNGTRLVGADGTPLTVIGIRKINFCFTDTNFPHSVLVLYFVKAFWEWTFSNTTSVQLI